MPKRPCAIDLTPDERTILCGDKFGDVYALPLLGKPIPGDPSDAAGSPEGNPPTPKPFTPSANSKTVHTKGNREALRNQQRMASMKREKEVPNFDHQLLLGHVSLLTDLVSAQVDDISTPLGRTRSYILTADRDEHIRVSRGLPQAHIIEGYCLGHKSFIGKLHIPEGHKHLLLSGGGDDDLYLWNWTSQVLLQRMNLKGKLSSLRGSATTDGSFDELSSIAISGIWSFQGSQGTHIFVSCEA